MMPVAIWAKSDHADDSAGLWGMEHEPGDVLYVRQDVALKMMAEAAEEAARQFADELKLKRRL